MHDKSHHTNDILSLDAVSIMADLIGVTYEAKQAVPIGTVAAIIVCVAVGAVVILDCNKLILDIQMMKNNIKDMMQDMKTAQRKNTRKTSVKPFLEPVKVTET